MVSATAVGLDANPAVEKAQAPAPNLVHLDTFHVLVTPPQDRHAMNATEVATDLAFALMAAFFVEPVPAREQRHATAVRGLRSCSVPSVRRTVITIARAALAQGK